MSILFDGRTVIVTGAGTGLGRAHALAFARRGARVVVNDLGSDTRGTGQSSAAAEAVVDEIRAAGGAAVADSSNIADRQGARRLAETALEAFGRIDVLVNNAGFLRDKTFAKVDLDDFEAICAVHLLGAAYCSHAVWPVMMRQGYGRIVMTTSGSGLFGSFGQSAYSAAKAGQVGLMLALSLEGKRHGIFVNAIAPAATTRLTEHVLSEALHATLRPDFVSAGVLFLAGESAPTGITLSAGGGYFSTVRVVEGRGLLLRGEVAPESIERNWSRIASLEGAQTYDDVREEMNHIYRSAGLLEDAPEPGTSAC